MAWIESHQSLARHPKVSRLARSIGANRIEAIGLLHSLWWWAYDYAPDGDVSRFDEEEIAEACGFDDLNYPDRYLIVDRVGFTKALIASGWIDETGERRSLHDWDRYAGRYLKARSSAEAGAFGNHVRWHEKRGEVDESCAFCVASSGAISGDASGDSRGESERESHQHNQHNQQNIHNQQNQQTDSAFEDFWKTYPTRNGTKGSKKKAKAVWMKLGSPKRALAVEHLPAYAKTMKGYPKDAERYLRDEAWEGLSSPPDKPDGEGTFYVNDLTDEQFERHLKGLPV